MGEMMKKVFVAVLVVILGLALVGCNGSNGSQSGQLAPSDTLLDKTITMAGGDITFSVSSTWKESEGVVDKGMHELLFQTGTGMFSITHYDNSVADPFKGLDSIKKLYADSYGITNFKDISTEEFTRNGMSIVVFAYSYNDPTDGDTIERLAYVTKGNSQIVIFFLDYADRFDASNFEALLSSIYWK